MKKKQENWALHIGVILAVAGSAIGLGNFLRFPGQAALYGGGAFMIPYFIAILVLAIPLTWSEWALGRFGGRHGFNSIPGIYRSAGKKKGWTYLAAISVLTPLVINMYYIFIQAWCLVYALQYLTGILSSLGLGSISIVGDTPGLQLGSSEAYSQFFNEFIGVGADGSIFSNGIFTPLLASTVFCFIFNYYLIYRGISKGIEAFCKIAMPLLLLCSLVILIRVLTLGNPTGTPGQGLLDGLGFMWNPSRDDATLAESLSNVDVWLAATSQMFFSVSVGFGLIVTYASYVRQDCDIALAGLSAVMGNEFCEIVFGGLMIIPAAIMFLGAGFADSGALQSSFAMGFITLPNIFEQMFAGQFFGFLFFILLFLAAVTSAISMSQPSVAMFEESLGCKRKYSVLASAGLCGIGTFFVCYFSKDALVLDTFDFWFGSLALYVLATLQTILAAWVWGTSNVLKELDRAAAIRVPRFIGFVLKYVSTPYLIVIFLLWAWHNLGGRLAHVMSNPKEFWMLVFLAVVLGLYLLLARQALRRWEKQETVLNSRFGGSLSAKGSSTIENQLAVESAAAVDGTQATETTTPEGTSAGLGAAEDASEGTSADDSARD